MDNHVHLLIYINEKTPEHIFRHLGSAFVYWYNGKYERTGHLFQDRYKSEAVSTDQYFISVLRYIIRNPVAAGICRTPDQYLYSSGAEYLLGTNGITDKNDVFQFMSPTMLRDFLLTENTDQCMDINEVPRKRLTDESAKNLILREFGTCSPAVGKPKERNSLYHSIRSLVSDGISIRQLSRLTGISKKIIEKGLKDI